MWSFVSNKANKQWIWLALDVKTREIIAVHIGDRSREGTKKLWQSLPPVYRQCAVCSSDFWEASEQIIPLKRHQAVGKADATLHAVNAQNKGLARIYAHQAETGKTNYIERFNCTLRQRVSRFVSKTLSFSKKMESTQLSCSLFQVV